MWHASAAPLPTSLSLPQHTLAGRAFAALEGVGDASLGQWEEWGDVAYHVRRRLTPDEEREAGIEGVVDVRGTFEARKRLQRVSRWLPHGWTEETA